MSAPYQSRLSKANGGQRRFHLLLLAIVIGLAVHAILFIVASVPLGHGPKEVSATSRVEWLGEQSAPDTVWAEQVLLLDAEPLFVPSPWNAASDLDQIARLRDETELFPPFEPLLGPEDGIWQPPGEAPPPAFATLIAPPAAVARFGREPTERPAGSLARLVSIEIESMLDGAVWAAEEPLDAGGVPAPDTIWNPLEFLLVVDPLTGTGLPLRLNSSGSPEWDRAVARGLVRHPAVTRLAEGYFRVIVGR